MQETYKPLTSKQLLAFFAMVVGMFMAVLDIQIVASSLPVIAAGLSASSDELSWVQTSYLIAEVIIIPLTGFTARLLSTRISYFIAATGFTIMSFFCSIAWNIESMIIFRSLQGLFGGAMIPTVFGIIYIIFPPKQRPTVTIIIGLVVTIAPTLGPTLGGYITEILSWHFMFLLNVPLGIFVCITVFLYADFDSPNPNLLKNFDYPGVILLAITFSSLEYILEEGNRHGWFEDNFLLFLGFVAFFGFIGLIFWELTYINPVLDLTAFCNKNFTIGCIYSFLIGMGLYGAIYLLPLFLFSVAGYNTIQIGLTMMVTGIAQFISAPIAGKMAGAGVDLRIILGIGLGLFGFGCYLDGFLTPDSKFWEFFIPQIVRGLALMFCFIPVNNIALGTMPHDQVQNASGLYNLTRNLGGAFGLAIINNVLTKKTGSYQQYLNENITTTTNYSAAKIELLTNFLGDRIVNPEQGANFILHSLIKTNAFVLAINNIFMVIGALFIASIFLLPFTANVKDNSGDSHAH